MNSRLVDLARYPFHLTPRDVWSMTLEQWFIFAPTVDQMRAASTTT